MNENYPEIIGTSERDRLGLFLTAAARMGTAVENVEKDFWVCWTLGCAVQRAGPGRAAPAVQGRYIAVQGVRPHPTLEMDPEDKDGQTLLLWYPPVTERDAYIRSAVKIESGAKSALAPHTAASVMPYVGHDVADLDLRVHNIMAVRPERTPSDKIVILHGLRQWFGKRGELRQGG